MAGKPKDEYKPPRGCVPTDPTKRRWLFFGVPIGLVIIAAIAVGAAVGVSKSNQNRTAGSSTASEGTGANGANSTHTNGTDGTTGQSSGGAASVQVNFGTKGEGADGSAVDMADGGSFTYSNAFGGTWAVDPDNPYGVSHLDIYSVRRAHGRYPGGRRAGRRRCWRTGCGAKTTYEGE